MSKQFQLSFYRWAMGLADSDAVRLMHGLAREVYADLGGGIIEQHLAAYADIFARWRDGGEGAPGLREAMRAMGSRERGVAKLAQLREQAWLQARAEVFQRTGQRIPLPQSPESMDRQETAEERAMVRQLSQKLRQVSAFTEGLEFGRGYELGSGPASGSHAGNPGSGSFSPGSIGENVPEPVSASLGSAEAKGSGTFSGKQPPEKEPDPTPPTNKQIKIGIRRLIDAQVDRAVVKALEAEARSGRMSRAEFVRRIEELLGIRATA